MGCVGCGAELPETARFCPSCGARQPEEDPAKVAEYRTALRDLGSRAEPWAVAELAALRAELKIRASTHERLLQELASPPVERLVGAWLDAETLRDFRAGEQCLLRIRVVNESVRALRSVRLRWRSTATTGHDEVGTSQILGPGEAAILSLLLRPGQPGHHQLDGTVHAHPLRGPEAVFALQAVQFRVAGQGALQQSIHIDARSQRVGIFENIGAAPTGGVVGTARWQPIGLVAVDAAPAPAAEAAPTLPTGHRGPGTVTASGTELLVDVEGLQGVLVDLEDPGLRAVLSPGDRLQVTVLGADGQGRLLLSTRPPAAAEAPPAAATEAGPGELAEAVRRAAAGATVVVRGVQQGPIVLDRPVTLEAADGAVLEVARGAGLRIAADVVVKGLTVRGTSGPGSYSPDGVEVRGGRVVLEGCDVAVDGERALTPGRGVAVTGPATVEIRGGRIHGCGVGVAVDVSWGGFPTSGARGARVGVHGATITGNGLGLCVAGEGRELHVARCDLSANRDVAVRALNGAVATVEDCTPSTSIDRGQA